MLVMTIQKDIVAEKILNTKGIYLGDISKSSYAYLSPRYTIGYKNFSTMLNKKTGILSDCPIFGWSGSPCLESIDYTGNRCALFLDVPIDCCVFSGYDTYCDYLDGRKRFSDCILDTGSALWESAKGNCVQVCMGYINSGWIVDYSPLIPKGVYVDDCLRYCQVINAYLSAGIVNSEITKDRKVA